MGKNGFWSPFGHEPQGADRDISCPIFLPASLEHFVETEHGLAFDIGHYVVINPDCKSYVAVAQTLAHHLYVFTALYKQGCMGVS